MKHFMQIALLITVFVWGHSQTQAQTNSAGSNRARAGFLVGNFSTVTTIPPKPSTPKGASANGTSVIAWTLDSTFLSIEDQSSLFGHYKAHGMLGFDAQTNDFVLSMFNNFGDHPTYHGNFVGDTLVLQTKIAAPRGSFDQQLRWYKDDDTVRLKILNDFGKGFLLSIDQTATPASQMTK